MTSDKAAGAYLGLWTVTILLSRGLGILMGGALRDGLYALTQSHALSNGFIFGIEGLGLFVSILLLARVNIIGFARIPEEYRQPTHKLSSERFETNKKRSEMLRFFVAKMKC